MPDIAAASAAAAAPGSVPGSAVGDAADRATGGAADRATGGASVLRSVLGPVASDGLGTILAAESLLRSPHPARGNAGIPATEAGFERRPVDMSMLGRLMMGAENLDDRTLRVADADAALRAFASACAEGSGSGSEPGQGPGTAPVVGPGTGQAAAVVALAPVFGGSGVVGSGVVGAGLTGSGQTREGRARAGRAAAEPAQDPESLVELSRATGAVVVRGTNGGDALRSAADASDDARGAAVRAAILADLGAATDAEAGAIPMRTAPARLEGVGYGAAEARPAGAESASTGRAGVVGFVSADDPVVLVAAAEAAAQSGVALVLAPTVSLAELERALDRVVRAGLDRSRVIVTGASGLISGSAAVGEGPAGARTGAPTTAGAPRLGVDPSALDALLDLGTHVCFDDLGRIPNVRTVVSDHDVALAILRAAERGAGDRILLSSGIREKHRLSAFGGNGLEFVPQQFLPYLRMCGADESLVRAVGGGNAARALAIAPADIESADTALAEGATA